jgi:hypothetical protein
VVRGTPSSEKLLIRENINGHIGTTSREFEMVHVDLGYGKQNQEEEEILNFIVTYDLMIANTFF